MSKETIKPTDDNNDNSAYFRFSMIGLAIIFLLVVATKYFFVSDNTVVERNSSNDYKIPHAHLSNGKIWQTGELSDHTHDSPAAAKSVATKDVAKTPGVKKSGAGNGGVSGEKLYAKLGCIGCHGQAGKSKNPMFPALAGKSKAFIISALKDFQNGTRNNPMMVPNAIKAKGSEEKIAGYLAAQEF